MSAAAFALVAMAACGPAPTSAPPPHPQPIAPRQAAAPPPAPIAPLPQPRRVAARVTFDGRGLHVRVVASGEPAELGRWTMPEDPMEEVAVEDGEGVAKSFERLDGVLEVGAPRSVVAVIYDVRPAAIDDDTKQTLVEASRFRALGERVLVLPAAFERERIEATIEIDAHGIDAPVAASTFGTGGSRIRHVVRTTGGELRRIALFAGAGGHAVFDAPEGHDETAWLGYTAFDPRAVAAEVAGFRGLLHEYFRDAAEEPSTMLVVADPRPRGRFRIMRRGGGLLVTVSGKDPFDAPLRLAVAHELVHTWIGDRLWLGDPTPGHEAESYWFNEGFARWVAREELARAGLLSPDELAAEVDRLLGLVVTARPGKESVATSVARGALYATLLDARIRDRTRGARSLDDLLRALVGANEGRRVLLSPDAFFAAAAKEAGDVVRTDFDDVVASGRRTTLPEGALGGCFTTYETRYEEPEPEPAESTTAEVDREPRQASAKPPRPTRKGQAFKRRTGLSDDACKKLALRK